MARAAKTALQIDPLLAEAHAAMGLLYSRKLGWQKAEESFRRAIDLNPRLTQIYNELLDLNADPAGIAGPGGSIPPDRIPGTIRSR
jgi:hypothetical protein